MEMALDYSFEIVKKTSSKVLDGEFNILFKTLDSKAVLCQFCEFSDICKFEENLGNEFHEINTQKLDESKALNEIIDSFKKWNILWNKLCKKSYFNVKYNCKEI